MPKYNFLIVLFFLSASLSAQQFSSDLGKVISSFDYRNSQGEKLENLQSTTNNHIAFGFNLPLMQSNFYFLSGLAYNKYGAKGSDELVGNYYEYNVNYLGINVGGGYEFFKGGAQKNFKNMNSEEAFTVFVQVSGGSEFLVQGNQTINQEVYDLKGVEQFDKPFIFVQGGVGVKYYATRAILVFVQYLGGKSFGLSKSSEDQETLKFNTHTISLGVGINLPAYKR